jgi:DNA replication protein DnaC
MGEFMDKWLPEMKNQNSKRVPQGRQLFNDQKGRQYYEEKRKCKDCAVEFTARIYVSKLGIYDFNKYYCPGCQDKKAKEFDEAERDRAETSINDQREKWRISCGIPKKYLYSGFEQFEMQYQPKPFKRCREYAAQFSMTQPQKYPSLVLFSDHTWGTGKTHLVCSIAHNILNRWAGDTRTCPVKFVSEPVLFESIRETINYSFEEKASLPSAKDIINSCIGVPLLILDDLGKEEVSDLRFVQRTLFSIFDGRYNAELPVVVTANLNDAGLRAHMGGNAGNEASFNRLFEMCKGQFIQVDGKSYRDILAKQGNVERA